MNISMWGPTEWAAAATVANAVLVLILVAATIFYALQTQRTVTELAEARILETLPLLHWQRHPRTAGALMWGDDDRLRAELKVLLTNYGRGAARLLSLGAVDDQGAAFDAPGMVFPSTLPAGAEHRIELRLFQNRAANDYPGQRVISIRLRYADAHSLRVYETTPRVTANWPAEGKGGGIVDFDADERSPAERRL